MSRAPVGGTYVADVLPGLVVMGLGLGFTFVPMTLIATTNVAHEDAGLASGLFNTSQQIGGALGLAILSTIATNRTTDHLSALGHVPSPADMSDAVVTGYHAGFIAGAGMLLLGVVDVGRIPPQPRPGGDQPDVADGRPCSDPARAGERAAARVRGRGGLNVMRGAVASKRGRRHAHAAVAHCGRAAQLG